MTLLFLILGPLAVWRIVHMLQEESGPAAIFPRFRAWLAANTPTSDGSFFDGFSCFKCLSVWIAAIYALFLGLNFVEWMAAVFAISTVAIFLNALFSKLDR